METLTDLLTGTVLSRLAATLAVLAVWFALRILLHRFAGRHVRDAARHYTVNKAINYTLGILLLVVLTILWAQGGTGLAAYLGILSAGMAIALQDPLTNLAGWLFILARRPFVIGDRIEIGEHAGDVVDLRLFQFTLVEIGNWVDADQSTGRVVHVPNGWVFRRSTANYTQDFDFVWDEIPVTITFESDWQRAKQILHEVVEERSALSTDEAREQVRKAARHFRIMYQHLTPIVWTSVADIGVTLTLRYLVAPRARRSIATGIWEEILTRFRQEPAIDFAYPTTRFYDNAREGKPGAGGPSTGPAAPSSD